MSVSGLACGSTEMLERLIRRIQMNRALRLLPAVILAGTAHVAFALPGCLPVFDPTVCTQPPTGTSFWWQDLIDLELVPEYDGTGVTVVVMEEGFPRNADVYLPADHIDYTYAASFGPQGEGSLESDHQTPKAFGHEAGHAIAVAGVIVGVLGVPKPFDTAYGSMQPGAAPGAKVVPVSIYNESHGGPSRVPAAAAAFRYVARLKAEGKIGPVIINCSWRWIEAPQDLLDAIDEAIAQGVIVIAVAGNDGPEDNTVVPVPGGHTPVITVGGVGWLREGSFPEDACRRWFFEDVPEVDPASEVYVTKFASRGPEVDLVAPAVFILGWFPDGHGVNVSEPPPIDGSEIPSETIHGSDGTSFAAPLVSSVVARMLQKNPTLTQGQVEGILKASAFPIAEAPNGAETTYSRCLDDSFIDYEYYYQDGRVPPWGATATGAGLLNARRALDLTPLP